MQCPKGCRECSLTADRQVTCTLCTRTPLDPKTGQCQSCADPHCLTCLPDDEPKACQECVEGYGLVEDTCKACQVAGCATCDEDVTQCTTCTGNATVVNGTACVACPAGCEACEDPASCTYCREGNLTWDAEKGSCVPCAAQDCNNCASNSADKCEVRSESDRLARNCSVRKRSWGCCTLSTCACAARSVVMLPHSLASPRCCTARPPLLPPCNNIPLQSCQLGFDLNTDTQQCEPVTCKVAGCLSCYDDPARCDADGGCGASKFYDEANNACSPCSEGCATCSKWGCGRCSDGYWMEEASRTCKKVRVAADGSRGLEQRAACE